jgi:PIN domain
VPEKKFLLIDYENIQPRSLETLKDENWLINVFLGSSQASLPIEKVKALQIFGSNVEYIQSDGNGPNAIDFHIAYYLGRLALENPRATFRVMSKDTGFDPLIRHLKKKGIDCERIASVPGVTKQKQASSESPIEHVEKFMEFLRKRSTHRPGTIKRLRGAINAHLGGKLTEAQVDEVLKDLENRGVIAETAGKLTYSVIPDG